MPGPHCCPGGSVGGANELPTAMHALADVHDTALRLLWLVPAGLGVGWTVHWTPFHSSARVFGGWAPTDSHAIAEVHDTPRSLLEPGSGVGASRHLWPSQITVRAVLPERRVPIATQAAAELQETAESSSPRATRITFHL